MTSTDLDLNDRLSRVLATVSTGHEMQGDACRTVGDITCELRGFGWSRAQVANALGTLRRRGLIEKESNDWGEPAEWTRFDSGAPGLESAQRKALAEAESTRPVSAQVQALDWYGPQGVFPRQDVDQTSNWYVARAWAEHAAESGLFWRAASYASISANNVPARSENERMRMRDKARAYRRQARRAQAVPHGRCVTCGEVTPHIDMPSGVCTPCRGALRPDEIDALEREARQAATPAQARPALAIGDTLPNGATIIDKGRRIRVGIQDTFVLALTAGLAGHPFATWHLNPETGATHSGTYHDTVAEALGEFRDRLGLDRATAGRAAPHRYLTMVADESGALVATYSVAYLSEARKLAADDLADGDVIRAAIVDTATGEVIEQTPA